MGTERTVRSLYDATASRWSRSRPSSLSDFTGRPPTLALCGDVRDRRVLDLGCGEGYCARALREAGAAEIVGVDVSAGMIELARTRELDSSAAIEYRVGEATDLTPLEGASFDLVLAVFLYNYLSLEDTVRSMAEVARVLRPGGRFVFAVPHPSFAFLKRRPGPPFYFDTGDRGYFSGRGTTFPGRIWKRDGEPLDVRMCHKTLEDYFEALQRAGFAGMPRVRELGVTDEHRRLDADFFAGVADVPLHLAIAAER